MAPSSLSAKGMFSGAITELLRCKMDVFSKRFRKAEVPRVWVVLMEGVGDEYKWQDANRAGESHDA